MNARSPGQAHRLRAVSAPVLRRLTSVSRPAGHRWPTALAAAVSLGLPIVVGDAVGHAEWGVVSAAGGFLSVYGAERHWRTRRQLLPRAGAVMLVGAVIGVATATSTELALVGMWLATIVTAWLAVRLRLGIPGPLMPVLAAGMCGRAAAPAGSGGLGDRPWLVLLLFAGGMGLAYAVGSAPVPARRTIEPEPSRPWKWMPHPRTGDRTIVLRIWAAATCALGVLVLWPQGQPYWVFLTMTAILQATPRRRITLVRAHHRVLGTTVGLVLFSGLHSMGPQGVLLGVTVGLLQACVEVLTARHYAIGLVFVTPAALLLVSALPSAAGEPVAAWRLADTVVGAGLAVAVVLVETYLDPRSGLGRPTKRRQPTS